MRQSSVSRRAFLGTAAALGAVGSLAGLKPLVSSAVAQDQVQPATHVDETVYSWCRQCVLPPCGIKVGVKDGVAVTIEGNPDCLTNNGKLCARGNSTLLSVYNPYRVKSPLKRTNPKKGIDEDPGWKEISWDEAFSEIAEKLKAVRAEDPRKFVWLNGFARAGSMIEGGDFCEAFGTPNYVEVDGPTCSVHFGVSMLMGNFTGPVYDPLYTNLYILMGKGEYESCGYAPSVYNFSNALARGMKVISIDPVAKMEGSKGEWVPIKPGTDLAFILAMQYVIVHEIKKMDDNFLKRRTNAPYLIGPDRHYVRDAATNKPLVWDAAVGQAKTFDDASVSDFALDGSYEVNGASATPAFAIYSDSLKEYTPEWAEEICAIPADTTRRIAKEFVEQACIGATISINGVPYPYRPVCLEIGRGAATQYYGGLAHASSVILHMLVGALDVPGAGTGGAGPAHRFIPTNVALTPDADGIVIPKIELKKENDTIVWPPQKIDGHSFFPYAHDTPHLAIDAILHPEVYHLDYVPTVMQIWAGNPLMRIFSPSTVAEALLKMEYIYTISNTLDEPTMFADIVLPEAVGLERWCAQTRPAKMKNPDGSVNHVICNLVAQQVIDPVYGGKTPEDIFIEIADRVGILYGENGLNANLSNGEVSPMAYTDPFKPDINTRYTSKELAELGLKSQTLGLGDFTLDGIRNESVGPRRILPLNAAYPSSAWPMGTTRYALYMEGLLSKGENLVKQFDAYGVKELPGGFTPDELMKNYFVPVVHWVDRRRPTTPGYDLLAFNWKTAQHSFGNGASVENPWLIKVSKYDPLNFKVCINPKTATEKGLVSGDTVNIESAESGESVEGEVYVTELVQVGTVGISGLFGHTSPFMNPAGIGGMHFNKLMSTSPADIDPLGGGFDGMHYIKITKL